ncbi:MAG: HPr family phosphocarrier protein [Desulfonauticus sp.]|nr:HPr family phosphocarrier protein [Desulfonauticus sp.]
MEEFHKTVVVQNNLGLHARPAGKLSKEAMKFQADITLSYKDMEIDAKSILDILTLGVPKGDTVLLKAKGKDAREAVEALAHLFENRFGEER